MPEVELPGWLEALLVLGAAGTAVVAIISATMKVGTISRWVARHAIDELVERVEVALDRQAIADDVEAKLSVPLGRVLAQLEPNGGSSLNDGIRRIERHLRDHIEVSAADRQRLWHAYGVMAGRLGLEGQVVAPPPGDRTASSDTDPGDHQ